MRDATVEPIKGASLPILRASPGSDPQRGPSSTRRRAPVSGDATKARRSLEQGPRLSGMRPRRRAEARGLEPARIGPLSGRTYALRAQALLRRPRANAAAADT